MMTSGLLGLLRSIAGTLGPALSVVFWDQRHGRSMQLYAENTPVDALGLSAAMRGLRLMLAWTGEIAVQIPTKTMALFAPTVAGGSQHRRLARLSAAQRRAGPPQHPPRRAGEQSLVAPFPAGRNCINRREEAPGKTLPKSLIVWWANLVWHRKYGNGCEQRESRDWARRKTHVLTVENPLYYPPYFRRGHKYPHVYASICFPHSGGRGQMNRSHQLPEAGCGTDQPRTGNGG